MRSFLFYLTVMILFPVFSSETTAETLPAALTSPANFIPEGQESMPVKLDFIIDTSRKLTLEDVRSKVPAKDWKSLKSGSINFGYVIDPIWLRFTITNPTSRGVEQILDISYPQLDFVDYYRLEHQKVVNIVHTGDHRPYSQRAVDNPNFLFPISLAARNKSNIYLRIQTNGSLQIPLQLWNARSFFIHINKADQIQALYYGILLVIIIFNFFVFVALREKTYLYYSLSTLGFLLFFTTLRATTFELLWPDSPWMQNQMMLLVIPVALLFSTLFSQSFLSLKTYAPRLNKVLSGIVVLSILAILLTFVTSYNTSIRISLTLIIPCFLLLLGIGPYAWFRGVAAARYYTFAWGALTLGGAIEALNKYGFLPTNFLTDYGMQIGSAFEAILLTVALAERLYREREEKLKAQSQILKEHENLRQAEQKLIHHALHHPITGLPNRARYEVLVKEHLASKQPERLAICLVHLMRFQEINKTLGYNNADLLLGEIGKKIDHIAQKLPGIIIIEQDRTPKYACSFEGASFGLILDADKAQAELALVKDIIAEMFKPSDFKNMKLELAPAAGVAISPDHGLDAATLIRHAHVALESAENNQGRLAYYRAEQDKYNARRLTIMSELKRAIKTNQLTLFYQPKYSFKTKTVVAVEALLRWNHHHFGYVPPDEFIPIAEQTGIIQPLTQWVIRQALSHQCSLLKEGFNINVSINISAIDLRNPEFIDFIQEEIKNHDLTPELITIELTETAMMSDPKSALKMLEKLRKTGVKLSIDDFGTGYSSLYYLKALPADEIKIDKSLVFDLSEQPTDQVIIIATIEMCHALGFEVVAEGVENQSTMNTLQNIGCDRIQGYFLSPPLPFDKLKPWLRNNNGHQNEQMAQA